MIKKMDGRAWKYKVVKRMRSQIDGEWFDLPGQGFVDLNEAIENAKEFADEQAASKITATTIRVVTRKNPEAIVTFRLDEPGKVRRIDWVVDYD